MDQFLGYLIQGNFIIGVIPIYSGNNLSRSIGWGYKPIQFSSTNIQKLHQIIKIWNKAEIGYYDIWDIQIQTYENCCFYQIKISRKQRYIIESQKNIFTNYFELGQMVGLLIVWNKVEEVMCKYPQSRIKFLINKVN